MGRTPSFTPLAVLCAVAASSLLPGCSKETITQPILTDAPHLVVSPDTLDLTDKAPSAQAFLSTDAPGTLKWRLTGKPAWVQADRDSGQATQTLSHVTVTGSAQGLAVGMHGGTLVFHSGGGEDRVYVRFSVGEHPMAAASVTSLHFPAGDSQESFTLRNEGTGLLVWSMESSEPWVSVSPGEGVLTAGQAATVFVGVFRDGQPPGTASASLTITSTSEGGEIEIPLTMEVAPAPQLGVSSDSLRYDYFVNSRSFRVWNSGNAPLTWNAAASQPFLQLASTSGQVAPGETTTVVVTLDRTGLATGSYLAGITVTADAQSRSIGAAVRHFVEAKWLLDRNLVDAEYDRVHDRIVAVGSAGASWELILLDPVARTRSSLTLPLAATCVSLHPNGLSAAVGHNGYVSHVNLATLEIEDTFPVSADAVDVVLAPNGWAYVFPRIDQWETIRCVNLATGAETQHTGNSIRAGTLARLHPSGDYIYGANNGLSPSDIEKYDIRGGTASLLYDSPYHGDYAFSGNLWFSDDGQRIFARSGNVFRASTVRADDMFYNGSLEGTALVQWAEHSTAAAKVFVLPADTFSPAPAELRVYQSSFLGFLGLMALPPFLVPNGTGGGTLHAAKGRFVFANGAGTRVHVLVRAAGGSGLVNDWAVASFDVSALP